MDPESWRYVCKDYADVVQEYLDVDPDHVDIDPNQVDILLVWICFLFNRIFAPVDPDPEIQD